MKITITAVPKPLTRLFPNTWVIADDENCLYYIEKMKEFIFGRETLRIAYNMGLDIFTLVFIKDAPFKEVYYKKVEMLPENKRDVVLTGLLINAMYRGKPVRIVNLYKQDNQIKVSEPQLIRLNIIDTDTDYAYINKKLIKKAEKNGQKKYGFNEMSSHYMDTISMGLVKDYIRKAINEKEFLDKINIKRFSKDLRINNRPASIDDINMLLQKRRKVTLIDLTDTSARMYLSALYAITFKNIKIEDIFNVEKVFLPDSPEERICSEAASEFINIIYNGNGIEICDILVKMAEVFSKMEMPSLQEGKLGDIFNNYTIIYAAAAIAYKFDKAFSRHEHLKMTMRMQMIDRFWGVYCNILLYKKYGDIISFCHSVADIDLKRYRDDHEYENSIIRSFEAAERAVRDINEERKIL